MDNIEQIRELLSQIMILCDRDQNWAIKKLAKISLATTNVSQAMQYPIAQACEKALEEIYTNWAPESQS